MATPADTAPAGTAPEEAAPPTGDGRSLRTGGGRRLLHAAWVVPLLLVLVAGSLRFYRLHEPDRIYFDETYYVTDARALLDRGVEEGFVVHPPLGKWMVAASIAAFGDQPAAWRAPMALAGTLTVLMTYLAGLRLLRRRGLAALAALLVTVDGLAFTMSRITMLDAILTMFVMLGFWLLLLDRDEQWAGVPATPADPSEQRPLPVRSHRFRWLAGIAFGLAVATKWSALLAIGAAGLLVLGSELAFRRATTGRWWTGWPQVAASGIVTLLLVPAAIYVASYASWFANYELTRPGVDRCPDAAECDVAPTEMLAGWWGEQRAIAGFHGALDATHRYRAPATTWPAMTRPVAYYYESCTPQRQQELEVQGEECAVEEGRVAEILGAGNPAIWWTALAANPVLAWLALRRRQWAAGAIGLFILCQYVPYLVASRPLFLFYMTPVVPFMALGLTTAAALGLRHPRTRWLPAALAVLAVASFVFFYPVWAGMEIAPGQWRLRMWSTDWI